jgi:hypothetical protein
MSACVVDQDATHQIGSDGKKMSSTLPVGMALRHKLQIGLMNKRSRLQRMVWTLMPQVQDRQPVKLLIDHGHQLIGSILIAVCKPFQ